MEALITDCTQFKWMMETLGKNVEEPTCCWTCNDSISILALGAGKRFNYRFTPKSLICHTKLTFMIDITSFLQKIDLTGVHILHLIASEDMLCVKMMRTDSMTKVSFPIMSHHTIDGAAASIHMPSNIFKFIYRSLNSDKLMIRLSGTSVNFSSESPSERKEITVKNGSIYHIVGQPCTGKYSTKMMDMLPWDYCDGVILFAEENKTLKIFFPDTDFGSLCFAINNI